MKKALAYMVYQIKA